MAGHADSITASEGQLLRIVARHLVDFWTWHSLVIAQGLEDREAVRIAVRLLMAVTDGEHGHDDGAPGPA